MSEQQQSDYLDLIQKLLGCPGGEEAKLLADNQHLLDADFLQMCEQVALVLTEQRDLHAAAWLRDLVFHLTGGVVNSNSSSEGMTPEKFILYLLQACQESAGDKSVLHPILKKHSDLLTLNAANLLTEVFTQSIVNADDDTRKAMAAIMYSLGFTLRRLPFGSPEINYTMAISAFNNSLRIFTETAFPELWAPTINELGASYRDIAALSKDPGGCLQMSINAHIGAMRIFTEANDQVEWANTNDYLGCSYVSLAEYSEDPLSQFKLAISAFNEALKARSRLDFPIQLGGSMHNLGCAYKNLSDYSDDPRGELEQAVDYFSEALRIYKAENKLELCATTNSMLGETLIKLSDYSAHPQEIIQSSIDALTSALQVFSHANQPNDWASANASLGAAYCKKVQHSKDGSNFLLYLKKSTEAFSNALELYKSNDQKKKYYNILIDYSLAISGIALLACDNSTAEVRDVAGKLRSALQEITQQSDPLTWARMNNTLGIILGFTTYKSDNPIVEIEESIAAFANSLRVWTECGNPELWAMANKNIGDAHAKLYGYGLNPQENIEKSITAYVSSLRHRDPLCHSYHCFGSAQSLGDLGLSSGKVGIAIKGYSTAITAAENLRFNALHPARKEEIISEAIEVYGNLLKAYVQQGDFGKAFEVVDRSKCRNLVELLSERNLYPKGELESEVISRLDELRGSIAKMERLLKDTDIAFGGMESELLKSISNANDEGSQSARLAQVNSADETLRLFKIELEKLIHEYIQPIDPTFTISQKVQPLTFDQLKESLPDDKTIVVSWYVARDSLFAFIFTKHDCHPHCHQYPRPTLELLAEALNSYFNSYQLDRIEWLSSLPSALARLSSILEIEDIAATISDLAPHANQLILVPHRFLHLLPLHCLPFGSAHSTLLDRFPRGVRFAPSIQVLQLVQQRTKPALQNLFAVQNPTQDLRYSDLEVACIQHQFTNQAFVIKQQGATKKAFHNNATVIANSNCLHFACHGTFNFKEPQLSSLQLAPSTNLDDQQATANDLSDCLTLLDLFELDLRQARLVTLSACETGLTDLNSLSDEFVGLSSGFLYAGATNVVGTLWTVSDLSTSLLMIEFYRRLQEQETSNRITNVALALRQAQHWLRDLTCEDAVGYLHDLLEYLPKEQRVQYQEDISELENTYNYNERPYSNPFFWAAFCTIGQ